MPILYQNTVSVKASGPPFDNFYKKLYNKGNLCIQASPTPGKADPMERSSGILLPLFSLPSPYGIGTMGLAAYDFADLLHAAGQRY